MNYPKVFEDEWESDSLYLKKGDKLREFFIAGDDCYFRATHIELYGIDLK